MQRVLESNRHSTIIRSMGVPSGEVPDDLKYSKAKFEFPGSVACQKSVVNVTDQLQRVIEQNNTAAFPVRLPKHGFLTKANLVVKLSLKDPALSPAANTKVSVLDAPGRDLFKEIEWRTETAQTLSSLHKEMSYASLVERDQRVLPATSLTRCSSVRVVRSVVGDEQWGTADTTDNEEVLASCLADTNYAGYTTAANYGAQIREYLDDRVVGVRNLSNIQMESLIADGDNLTFVVPINFRMFDRLYTCPDLMSLEQTELLFHPSGLKLCNGIKFTVSSANLQLWYTDISPAAHDALLREMHGGGGQPFNYFGTHSYIEAAASPVGTGVQKGPGFLRAYQIELRCENPVRKTYITVESKDPIKSEYLPIISVKISDSGTTFFHSATAHELLLDQESPVNSDIDTCYRMYVIDWSREKLFSESSLNSVGTAISFQQMTNPTLEVTALDMTYNYNGVATGADPVLVAIGSMTSKMTVVHETYRAYSIAPRPDMRDRTIQVIQNK